MDEARENPISAGSSSPHGPGVAGRMLDACSNRTKDQAMGFLGWQEIQKVEQIFSRTWTSSMQVKTRSKILIAFLDPKTPDRDNRVLLRIVLELPSIVTSVPAVPAQPTPMIMEF